MGTFLIQRQVFSSHHCPQKMNITSVQSRLFQLLSRSRSQNYLKNHDIFLNLRHLFFIIISHTISSLQKYTLLYYNGWKKIRLLSFVTGRFRNNKWNWGAAHKYIIPACLSGWYDIFVIIGLGFLLPGFPEKRKRLL